MVQRSCSVYSRRAIHIYIYIERVIGEPPADYSVDNYPRTSK